jgi:protocatechuate 3,4-dioxygenase beta subunit
MKTSRRKVIREAGAVALLAQLPSAWPQSACEPAPQCRKDCGPTARATEGPFYVGNAPEAVDINPGQAAGTPMHVSGTVYSHDGVTPVANAKVEIWHADDGGSYHPESSGDIAKFRRSEINLRGTTRTDAQGRYAFDSIVPGHYGERRRHLHWKVSAPGHRSVTTQSYWLDERGTPRDKGDSTDRNVEACRWVDFRSQQGRSAGIFDIVLQSAA